MKKFSTFLLFVVLLATGASDATAQLALGPRLGIGVGDVEDPYLGVDVRFDAPMLPVQASVSGDYYLLDADNVSLYQITADGLFEFGITNQLFTPYAGGGLSLAFMSYDIEGLDNDTELGLHVVGGAVFELTSFRPFVQAEFTVGGGRDLYGVTGGVLFSLGG